MILTIVLYLFFFIQVSHELNNGLGRTPQMGWNSWNHFNCHINETIVRQIADAMVSTGLAAAGYQYVNLDDCWQGTRNAQGIIQPNSTTFPSGIPTLADYVHSRKLKFGLYSDRGHKTCAGRPGSLGYETKDANTYASWGVDYLKLDSCDTDKTPADVEYGKMRDALNATGRPIFYSLCGGVGPWAPSTGNSWRTTSDIQHNWEYMMRNIEQNMDLADLAAPGGWNDPDMLEVGNGGMSDIEYRTHFSLWSISKAPLIIGCDVRNINPTALDILTNREVIAVNQDPLGVQGQRIAFQAALSSNDSNEVLVANLSLSDSDPRRRQWIYNPKDRSIRSVHNGRCVSIDDCKGNDRAAIVLSDCHIGDPQAPCQGKNQQWIKNPTSQNIVSQMNDKCMTLVNLYGPNVIAFACNGKDNQVWTWNDTDQTLSSKPLGQYLTVTPELEIWAGPLSGGSQAVVLLNRSANESSQITVNWTDIGFPTDHSARVRDLWAHQDLGAFTGHYTSPKIDLHAVMMLNITLTK